MNLQEIEFKAVRADGSNFIPHRTCNRQQFNDQIGAGHPVFFTAHLEGKSALKFTMQCNDCSTAIDVPHPSLKTRSKNVFGNEKHYLALNKQQGLEAVFEYVRHAIAVAVQDGYQIDQHSFTIVTSAEQLLTQEAVA